MTRLEFLAGIEFEQCYRNILEAIRNYPNEVDPSERSGLNDFVELSYARATELGEQYGARDLLNDHTKVYKQFQDLKVVSQRASFTTKTII